MLIPRGKSAKLVNRIGFRPALGLYAVRPAPKAAPVLTFDELIDTSKLAEDRRTHRPRHMRGVPTVK